MKMITGRVLRVFNGLYAGWSGTLPMGTLANRPSECDPTGFNVYLSTDTGPGLTLWACLTKNAWTNLDSFARDLQIDASDLAQTMNLASSQSINASSVGGEIRMAQRAGADPVNVGGENVDGDTWEYKGGSIIAGLVPLPTRNNANIDQPQVRVGSAYYGVRDCQTLSTIKIGGDLYHTGSLFYSTSFWTAAQKAATGLVITNLSGETLDDELSTSTSTCVIETAAAACATAPASDGAAVTCTPTASTTLRIGLLGTTGFSPPEYQLKEYCTTASTDCGNYPLGGVTCASSYCSPASYVDTTAVNVAKGDYWALHQTTGTGQTSLACQVVVCIKDGATY